MNKLKDAMLRFSFNLKFISWIDFSEYDSISKKYASSPSYQIPQVKKILKCRPGKKIFSIVC